MERGAISWWTCEVTTIGTTTENSCCSVLYKNNYTVNQQLSAFHMMTHRKLITGTFF